MSVVEALAREVGSLGRALRKLSAGEWSTPTRCEPLTVLQLTAHMARGASRIEEMLAADAVDDEPEKDAVTYFQYDADAEAPLIAARAQDVAADIGDGPAMVAYWDEHWSRALRGARAADPARVGPTVFGTMRLDEYLKTRIVEVVIHHFDLDDALGHDVHPDPGALGLCGDVLRGLLGTDLRKAGMDDVRFAYVGTGRAPLSDEERAYLGPLADRFPLFH